jgi:hypothetical protein
MGSSPLASFRVLKQASYPDRQSSTIAEACALWWCIGFYCLAAPKSWVGIFLDRQVGVALIVLRSGWCKWQLPSGDL